MIRRMMTALINKAKIIWFTPQKMLSGSLGSFTYNSTTGDLTNTSSNTASVIGKLTDTTTSTLPVMEIQANCDAATWNGRDLIIGLSTLNTAEGFANFDFSIFKVGTGTPNFRYRIAKVSNGGTSVITTYFLPLNNNSMIRVVATKGVTYYEVGFYASEDNGVTWSLKNVGGTLIVTAVPITSPLYGQINMASTGAVVKNVKAKL